MIYFAQKAFIVFNNKLLVVQKSKDDPNVPLKWEVPGGRMEEGEDVESHIKREVQEEVGLDIVPGKPFYIWQWGFKREKDSVMVNNTIVAVARLCTTNSAHTSDDGRVEDDNLAETKWIPLDEVRKLDWIPNMLPVVDAFLSSFKNQQ